MTSTTHLNRFATIAAAAVMLCTTMATAGVIQRRLHRQHARIHQGVQSGRLTVREAARLRAQQRTIRAERGRARADGVVTRAERRSIRHDQNHASRSIWRKKHNRRHHW